MIRAVIFDLDGVLVDAVQWHFKAFQRAASLFGYHVSEAEHHALYNGLPTSVKLSLLTQRQKFPSSLHGFVHEMKQIYTQEYIAEFCKPQPATTDMLRGLKAAGYLLGLASNSVRSTVELMLKQMEIYDLFDVILSHQNVTAPKPNPEIYQKACAALGVTAEQALIIEDSLPGIQSALQTTPNVAIVTGPDEVTSEFVWQQIRRIDHPGSSSLNTSGAIEVVIPMAGQGKRFADAGYVKPKPLIEVLGKPMIQWVVENFRSQRYPMRFTFICNSQQLEAFGLKAFLNQIAPGCCVVSVPSVTHGSVCTLMTAKGEVNPTSPLIIANSDQWVDADIDAFIDRALAKKLDGQILTFQATDPKWSYAKVDCNDRLVEVAEKKTISEHATVGIYYFRLASDFFDGAEEMIRQDVRVNGEFYTCPVYNQLLLQKKHVSIFEIESTKMHGLGTPEDLDQFLIWKAPSLGKFRQESLFPHQGPLKA